ncbi:MAG: hypothetical protein WA144_04650 [Candidatus Methanoperedens sp.]
MIHASTTDYNNIASLWSADGAKIELAAPFVSGVAFLVKSRNLSMAPQEIHNALALMNKGHMMLSGAYHKFFFITFP